MALAALASAVADLRQSQQRLHQAEAAYASADQLRHVAPLPVTTPRRSPNAADLAAMSFARKPGKVRPYKTATTSKKPGDDTAGRHRRDPGRGHGQSTQGN